MKKEKSEFYATPPRVVKCRIKGIRPNYNVLISFCLSGCKEKDCQHKKKNRKEDGNGF